MSTQPDGTSTALPLVRDYVIYQGSTWSKAFRWLRDGVPVDLSGWSGAMQMRRRADAAEPAQLDLTTVNGGVRLDANGGVVLYATDEQTGAMVSSGVYDVELQNPQGERFRFLMGAIELSREVTR